MDLPVPLLFQHRQGKSSTIPIIEVGHERRNKHLTYLPGAGQGSTSNEDLRLGRVE